MALKDTWIDKVDEVDDILAGDINDIAHSAIESEKNRLDKVTTKGSLRAYGVDEAGNQIIFPVTNKNEGNSLAMTDDYGNLKSSIPREDCDVVNKIYADNAFANGLRGKKSGTMVSMDDVAQSGDVLVNLRSKNLIPYPYAETTKTANGITFTDNGDGSITINGTATVATTFQLSRGRQFFSSATAVGYNIEEVVKEGICMSKRGSSIDNVGLSFEMWGEGVPVLFIYCGPENTYDNAIVYPQIEYGTTATPYTPYVADDTAVTVKSCGKNLIPYPHLETILTKNGVTLTSNNDGSVTINGTPTVNTSYILAYGRIFSGYIGCGVGKSATKDGLCISLTGDQNVDTILAFEVLAGGGGHLYILTMAGVTYNNVTVYPQIEVGDTPTEYEPYIEGETIQTTLADGAQLDSIAPNMTITTDNNGVILDVEYKRDTNIAFEKLEKRLIALETAIVNG